MSAKRSLVAVYCIAEIEDDVRPLDFSRFKIGVASNPCKRLSSLQTGNPRRLALIIVDWYRSRLDASIVERRAHEYLIKHGCRGEWFDGSGCPFEAMAVAGSVTSYIPSSDAYYDFEYADGRLEYSLLDKPQHWPGRGSRAPDRGWLQ